MKEAMVLEILSADSFYEFLLDQYGNYVIQKSLSVAIEPYFSQFIEKLKPDIERLRLSNDFGVKIYNRLIPIHETESLRLEKGEGKCQREVSQRTEASLGTTNSREKERKVG